MTPEPITLPQCSKQCAVQSTPVSQHEQSGHDRERVSCRGVIENACDSLQGGQRSFAPYLHESRPIPARQQDDLVQIKIGPGSNRSKSDKLKKEIAKPEERKSNPDAFIAPNATKTVPQRMPHRTEDHHNRVATAKPKKRIQVRQMSPHVSKQLFGRAPQLDAPNTKGRPGDPALPVVKSS